MALEPPKKKASENIELGRARKQSLADAERESYLTKLRDKSTRRDTVRELREKAIKVRAAHAENTSKAYIERIARRSEFRSRVKLTFQEGHKFHEEIFRILGQQYREKLVYMVGRTLEPRPLPQKNTTTSADISARIDAAKPQA